MVSDDTYNKLFTMHGVMMVFFFLIPAIPAVLGNFLIPIMIGAKDLAFPKLNLASWYIYMIGATFTTYAIVTGGLDTGWTFYTPFSTASSTTNVIPAALGHLHHRVLVDPDGPQLHRHDPQDAGSGHDVVPAAAVRLVALRHEPHHGARDARPRHHHRAGRGRTRVQVRHLRPGARRRPDPLPASVLVLLAPGGLHHGAARRWASSASSSPRSAASRSSATRLWPSRASALRSSASSCGATTCSSRASRSTRR